MKVPTSALHVLAPLTVIVLLASPTFAVESTNVYRGSNNDFFHDSSGSGCSQTASAPPVCEGYSVKSGTTGTELSGQTPGTSSTATADSSGLITFNASAQGAPGYATAAQIQAFTGVSVFVEADGAKSIDTFLDYTVTSLAGGTGDCRLGDSCSDSLLQVGIPSEGFFCLDGSTPNVTPNRSLHSALAGSYSAKFHAMCPNGALINYGDRYYSPACLCWLTDTFSFGVGLSVDAVAASSDGTAHQIGGTVRLDTVKVVLDVPSSAAW